VRSLPVYKGGCGGSRDVQRRGADGEKGMREEEGCTKYPPRINT